MALGILSKDPIYPISYLLEGDYIECRVRDLRTHD